MWFWINLALFFFLLIGVFYVVMLYVRAKVNLHRTFNMVFLNIKIPKKDSKDDKDTEGEQFASQGDFKEVTCGVMSQFFEALYSIYAKNWHTMFTAQDFLSFEYVVLDSQVNFFVVCPRELVPIIEKQVTSFYPDSVIEQVDDYNIFNPDSEVVSTYLVPGKTFSYPIKTYERMKVDPVNAIVNSLSKIGKDEGAAIQIMLRPMKDGWQKKGRKLANEIFQNKKSSGFAWYNPLAWIASLLELIFKGEVSATQQSESAEKTTPVTDEEVKAMEEKNSKSGFEVIIRLVSAANTKREAGVNLSSMAGAFSQYTAFNGNAFANTKLHSNRSLVTNFIFRNFKKPLGSKKMIFSTDELASIYHFPSTRFNRSAHIAWQNFKIAPAPPNIPKDGLLLGHNIFRGKKTEIMMKREDRFRHFYVIGQTGTGKSSVLQVMIRQDLKNGDGICVIDPHGSLIEDILPFIPRERADDVIYFNPSDMERPLGINLLEGDTWEEKEKVALDAMNIMIKLFNEEVFGPRIQDYFRNGCLTLMSDPEGGALTDIVRLFTDDDFAKIKRQHITNPIVASFWDNQMAKTGAREKAEMIPYFAAKFGQFVTNTMMRNIIGQTQSAFDFSRAMQEKKILLMNLSKGTVGEVNSKLLGLIIVQKLQMAALDRESVSKSERSDFFLYIDEFQNYITDSIEVILSEARKYRLGLNLAHQYLGQLEDTSKGGMGSRIKDAIFGNVGSMMCYKIGAQDAEHMSKEMSPVFSEQDLISIDKFKAVMKLSIDTQPSRPFSIIPVNPYLEEGDKQAAEAYKQLSRLKYGRDRDFVEREILRRIGAA